MQELEVWGVGGATQVELGTMDGTDRMLVSTLSCHTGTLPRDFQHHGIHLFLGNVRGCLGKSRTSSHVDSGVDRANVVLLVVSTAHVETSMSLVLVRGNGAGKRHGGSNNSTLHLDDCLLGIKQFVGVSAK